MKQPADSQKLINCATCAAPMFATKREKIMGKMLTVTLKYCYNCERATNKAVAQILSR